MQSLILASVMIGKLAFETQKEKEIITIMPVVTLPVACQCQVTIEMSRKGQTGQSTSRQQSTVGIPQQMPHKLAKMVINAAPGDDIKITVDVSDGKEVHLRDTWSLAGQNI